MDPTHTRLEPRRSDSPSMILARKPQSLSHPPLVTKKLGPAQLLDHPFFKGAGLSSLTQGRGLFLLGVVCSALVFRVVVWTEEENEDRERKGKGKMTMENEGQREKAKKKAKTKNPFLFLFFFGFGKTGKAKDKKQKDRKTIKEKEKEKGGPWRTHKPKEEERGRTWEGGKGFGSKKGGWC